MAQGERLRDALEDAGYRAMHSSVMSMSGAKDNGDIARMLGQRACTDLRSDDVREIGIETRGNSVWVVFAAPFAADALKNAIAGPDARPGAYERGPRAVASLRIPAVCRGSARSRWRAI